MNDIVAHLHASQTGMLNKLLKTYVSVTFPYQPKSILDTLEPRKRSNGYKNNQSLMFNSQHKLTNPLDI